MMKIEYEEVHVSLHVGPKGAITTFGESDRDYDKASLQLGDLKRSISIILDASHPTTVLSFLDSLIDDAKQARCWMLRQLCDCCEEKTKEPGSRYCSECNNDPYTDPAVDPRGK